MSVRFSADAPPVSTVVCHDRDPAGAAEFLCHELSAEPLCLVLFFCSADYDPDRLSAALGQRFAEVPVVGCTTAGEITPEGYSTGSITAIGFCERYFSIQASLVRDLASFDFSDAQLLVHDMLDQLAARQVAPLKGHSFMLSLLDGLSIREEQVLNVLSANLGSIPLLGGSAGDDLHFRDTHVFFDGAFHSNAAILLLVNTVCDFEVFSTDHLRATEEKLVVTDALWEQRRVLELNAEPAALAYAGPLGLEPDQLDSGVFALNPLSVRIGDRYYPRAIQRVNDDLSLSFYCAVESGVVLTRARAGDIVSELEALFQRIRRRLGAPQLVIGYDCIFRRLEIDHLNICDRVSALLRENRVIGFNTYGEQFDGMHLNQTFTGVALGGPRLEQERSD